MHYQVLSHIQVQQVPTDQYPDRNLLLEFSFMNSYDAFSTWEDLTQTLKLVLPKRVRIKSSQTSGNPFSYIQLGNTTGKNSNLGGFDAPPTFLRGDIIKMNLGYRAMVGESEVTYWTGEKGIPDMFKGFISAVNPKLPFTLECEDNMWLCKQIPTPARNWGKKSLQQIVQDILDEGMKTPAVKKYDGLVSLNVSDFSKTDLVFNVSSLTTQRGSLAMFLTRLKSQYKVDSYFRGEELRIGYTHYVQSDTVQHTFTFQKNILDGDKLNWMRRDDVVMSAIVRSVYQIAESTTTLDGATKTKQASTEVLVYLSDTQFTYIKKEKGKDYPAKVLDAMGEVYKIEINAPESDAKKLFNIGKTKLQQHYYDGFRGSFTTFGMPYVKHGDTVRLINNQLPEQNGLYKVKAVRYYGGYDEGLRQDITIDYKID